MQSNIMAPAKAGERNSNIAVEANMLKLFAPAHAKSGNGEFVSRSENRSLWRSDAIHRAKNLAQLSASLANLAEHPTRSWLPEEIIAQTRCLARAYEELGAERVQTEMVPCERLLSEVATRLTLIFGRARDIAIAVDADTVLLAPDMRRALILMCSELILNALKHAYPYDGGGIIRVGLTREVDGLKLVVEDDGTGLSDDYSAGQGDALLDRLGSVLDASITRSPGSNGHGCRVTVLMRIEAV